MSFSLLHVIAMHHMKLMSFYIVMIIVVSGSFCVQFIVFLVMIGFLYKYLSVVSEKSIRMHLLVVCPALGAPGRSI